MGIIKLEKGRIPGSRRYEVRLAHMASFFQDRKEVQKRLGENPMIYEVFERKEKGLSFATTILHPGKIGAEFFMTRGHAHLRPSPEVYIVLSGRGILLSEKRRLEYFPLERDCVAYVPALARHRTVNVGRTPLVLLAIYATDAGHDYGYVERHGFSGIVVAKRGGWRLDRRVGKKV